MQEFELFFLSFSTRFKQHIILQVVIIFYSFLVIIIEYYLASQRETFDCITDFSVFSNPINVQTISCLGLCGRDTCPKNFQFSTLSCQYSYNDEIK